MGGRRGGLAIVVIVVSLGIWTGCVSRVWTSLFTARRSSRLASRMAFGRCILGLSRLRSNGVVFFVGPYDDCLRVRGRVFCGLGDQVCFELITSCRYEGTGLALIKDMDLKGVILALQEPEYTETCMEKACKTNVYFGRV